jgi:membrane fusion protein, multidrug efflux system
MTRIAAKTGLVAVVAAAAVAASHFLLASTPPAPQAAAPAVPVVAAAVQQRDFPIVLEGLGTVQALNTATIRSQVTGVVQSVDFTEGQQVRRGDVLAQIDARPFQAQLDQMVAQLGRDQAQLANTQVNLGRNVPLLSQGFATEQLVTNQRASIAELQNTIKFDQGAIDNARAQLSYTTLAAPFDGVTGVRLLDVGNVIHPTDANGLVVVTQVQPISIIFTLPTSAIGQVQDALAKGTVKAVAYDQRGVKVLDTGQLLLINNQADSFSGTVQLKALFPNAQRHLWPGVFVNVELTTSVAKNALTIPTDAVQQGSQGSFVYVIGADHTVAVRPVEVTQRLRKEALIGKGLNPGETVVEQGQYRLVSGTLVTAAPPSQVANASTASSGMLP